MRALCGGLDHIGRALALLEGFGDLYFVGLALLGNGRRALGADPAARQGKLALCLGRSVVDVGHDDLGHQNATGGGHEGAGKQEGQVFVAEQTRICSEDRASNARHAHRHQREQATRRERGEIGPHDQRAFRLADEDIGRRTQRFDLADPGQEADRPAQPAHDQLHDAEVIEDGDQRGEEHDDRQGTQREGVGQRIIRSEQKRRARIRV